MTIAHLFEKFW